MKKKQLMAIINCTPDSFFKGTRFGDPGAAIDHGLKMIEEGADILDIGGESTRPGSEAIVSQEEEIRRVIPVIKGLRQQTNTLISIDTFKPGVAEAALDAGADWINDITGLSHPEMQRLACRSGATCCIMHMVSAPHMEHSIPSYPNGIMDAIGSFFRKRIATLMQVGLKPDQIILDPGIGGGAFGKTPENCLQIIKQLSQLTTFGYPILIGLSRKSFLQKILQKPPSEVLSTTLALNTMALLEGATYIRVHDVAVHRDILTVLERMEAVF